MNRGLKMKKNSTPILVLYAALLRQRYCFYVFFRFSTASVNSRAKISSISDIFDSVMLAALFTLTLILSAHARLALTCGWRKVEFLNLELVFVLKFVRLS